jgi:hypothetical protein
VRGSDCLVFELVKGASLASSQRCPLWVVGVLIHRRHELEALDGTIVFENAEPVEKWVGITSGAALL